MAGGSNGRNTCPCCWCNSVAYESQAPCMDFQTLQHYGQANWSPKIFLSLDFGLSCSWRWFLKAPMYKNIQSLSFWPPKTCIDFILLAINQPLAISLRNAKQPSDGSSGCSANSLICNMSCSSISVEEQDMSHTLCSCPIDLVFGYVVFGSTMEGRTYQDFQCDLYFKYMLASIWNHCGNVHYIRYKSCGMSCPP